MQRDIRLEFNEIGSEFWDIPLQDKENGLFGPSIQWFCSGRSALQSICKLLIGCNSVAMPSWCCDSMIKPFVDAGIKTSFYPVYFDGKLIQKVSFECDVLFLIDYFGYTGMKPDLNGFNGIVIRDITHSFFSTSFSDADYFFGSLRKWCGVWTGGYAWTKDGHKLLSTDSVDRVYVNLRKDAMTEKAEYLAGKRNDKDYLKKFNQAEEHLENVGIVAADERDIKRAINLNVEKMKKQRRSNAKVLMEAFNDLLLFSAMKDTDCPMFVPIIVPYGKRDALRRFLIEKDIYCPIHWPISEYHNLDERTRYIYYNELSLVCDQRYTEEDMNRMVETIKSFWKEL